MVQLVFQQEYSCIFLMYDKNFLPKVYAKIATSKKRNNNLQSDAAVLFATEIALPLVVSSLLMIANGVIRRMQCNATQGTN